MPSFIKLFIFIIIIFFYAEVSIADIVSSPDEEVDVDSTTYTIQSIGPYFDPDEVVINNKEYDPKTYCEMAVGDRVKFVVNTPDDCVDAKLLNLRTHKTCEVWCD